MGWSAGSALLSEVWTAIRDHIPDEDREDALLDLMYRFAAHDCDTPAGVVRDEWPESEPAFERWFNEPGDMS